MSIIPLRTPVEVRSNDPQSARKGIISFCDQEDDAPTVYTVEFEDGSTAEHTEEHLVVPNECQCGTPMQDVCLIPGTNSCFACHELHVMEQTGIGVVHFAPGIGAYMR